MSDTPAIPFGFKRVFGPAQKGDGIWDGTRFRKARKVWPSTEATAACIIRKCEVVQTELSAASVETIKAFANNIEQARSAVAEPVQTITEGPDCVGLQVVECDWL